MAHAGDGLGMSAAATPDLRHSRPSPKPRSGTETAGGWTPSVWLGAPAIGGLALPVAHPTAAHMYAPRGVWVDDDVVIAADSGNHRLMIWHGRPTSDEQPADVILCQPDVTSEGPNAAGRGPENGLHLPTGIIVHDNQMFVADSWHHRVLVWDTIPTTDDVPPDQVIGQIDLSGVLPNHGNGDPTQDTLYWPYGIGVVAGTFWITDTGNRRMVGWTGGPPVGDRAGLPPDLLIGQNEWTDRDENRGAEVAANSSRWPHDVAGTDDVLFLADAGNHRVVAWTPPPTSDRAADLVIGQADMVSGAEWPYGPHTADGHRFPYAISIDEGRMAVADTANNRVLVWNQIPMSSGVSPDHVLAQPDFTTNGENRWDQVHDDTLCWPYGLCLSGNRIGIADSGNNRIMLWEYTAQTDD